MGYPEFVLDGEEVSSGAMPYRRQHAKPEVRTQSNLPQPGDSSRQIDWRSHMGLILGPKHSSPGNGELCLGPPRRWDDQSWRGPRSGEDHAWAIQVFKLDGEGICCGTMLCRRQYKGRQTWNLIKLTMFRRISHQGREVLSGCCGVGSQAQSSRWRGLCLGSFRWSGKLDPGTVLGVVRTAPGAIQV